jgi:GNAT superfamily N-acetyltransferase
VDGEVLVRPMRADDLTRVESVTRAAFHDLAVQRRRHGEAEPAPRPDSRRREWVERTGYLLSTDPGGCWVVEVDGEVVGAATSIRRDLTWILVSYAVQPGHQGVGLGRLLMEAAMTHARGCLRGMVAASSDPAAARRYRLAGFSLHPTMYLAGRVRRELLPVVAHVRAGDTADFDLCDSLDRRVRDAAHGRDHTQMLATHRLLVVDRPAGSGYAYLESDGSPYLLAATSRRTASLLLWESLASTDPSETAQVRHLTPANQWAVDVGIEAGMTLDTAGYLALRGMAPPAPYIPSGHYL